MSRMYHKCKDAALYGTSVDIHEVVSEDPFIAALHARAEKFDEHAEHSFGYLQVGEVCLTGETPLLENTSVCLQMQPQSCIRRLPVQASAYWAAAC
jgi:hypothetical protein